jgi:hypothetical protein
LNHLDANWKTLLDNLDTNVVGSIDNLDTWKVATQPHTLTATQSDIGVKMTSLAAL